MYSDTWLVVVIFLIFVVTRYLREKAVLRIELPFWIVTSE